MFTCVTSSDSDASVFFLVSERTELEWGPMNCHVQGNRVKDFYKVELRGAKVKLFFRRIFCVNGSLVVKYWGICECLSKIGSLQSRLNMGHFTRKHLHLFFFAIHTYYPFFLGLQKGRILLMVQKSG